MSVYCMNTLPSCKKTGIIPNQIDNMTMNNLIGFAAHEKMYALMKPYFKE